MFLSPNPVSDIIHLKNINHPQEQVADTDIREIIISDITGKGNAQKRKCENQTIDVRDLPNGCYFITVIQNDGVKNSSKFIKINR